MLNDIAILTRILSSKISAFYIQTNLRILQHSNVKCSFRMFILCSKMIYFGDFGVLVPYISNEFMIIT